MSNLEQGVFHNRELVNPSREATVNSQSAIDLRQITADQIMLRSRKTVAKLIKFEAELKPEGNSFLSWLEQEITHESATKIARAVGVNIHTLLSIARRYGIRTLTPTEATKANWQKPEFREMRARQVSAQWHDPEYAARRIEGLRTRWQDTEYRERQASGIRAKWQDPEFRDKKAEELRVHRRDQEFERKRAAGSRAKWQDTEYRKRNAEATGAGLRAKWQEPDFRRRQIEASKTRWQDPEFRERQADGTRAKWQDSGYRERMAEVNRQARLDPRNLGRYYLPTIHGDRWDVGFAQSTWEANLARIIRLVGRDYLHLEPLRLENGSLYHIDFLTIDGRNRMVAYEIMVHPFEDPDGWIKLEEAITQYPSIAFKIVDPRFYARLRNRFEERINSDDRFAGWEGGNDNLRTNPQKYGNS